MGQIQQCPNCGGPFEAGQRFCQHCGAPLPEPPPPDVIVVNQVAGKKPPRSRADAFAFAMLNCPLAVLPDRLSPLGPRLADDEFLVAKYPRVATTQRIIVPSPTGAGLVIRDLADLHEVEVAGAPILVFAEPEERIYLASLTQEKSQVQLDLATLAQYAHGQSG
jgi:hypothetical protein